MEIAGYIAALIIGVALGLVGGGGSILTMPVLVYLFNVQPLLATSYSLFIVGSTSLVGAVTNYRKGLVNIRVALLFSITSISTVFLTRKFIIPLIPATIAKIGNTVITEPIATMTLFALLMLAAAFSMMKNNSDHRSATTANEKKITIRISTLLLFGMAVGLVTGFLGAGGGFLLIPTLVLFMGLPMKEAIGTSLFIIALNSLFGFTGDLGHFSINWLFLLSITLIAIAGIFIGDHLNKKIPGGKLKKGFGWFVLLMGLCILIKEIFLL